MHGGTRAGKKRARQKEHPHWNLRQRKREFARAFSPSRSGRHFFRTRRDPGDKRDLIQRSRARARVPNLRRCITFGVVFDTSAILLPDPCAFTIVVKHGALKGRGTVISAAALSDSRRSCFSRFCGFTNARRGFTIITGMREEAAARLALACVQATTCA